MIGAISPREKALYVYLNIAFGSIVSVKSRLRVTAFLALKSLARKFLRFETREKEPKTALDLLLQSSLYIFTSTARECGRHNHFVSMLHSSASFLFFESHRRVNYHQFVMIDGRWEKWNCTYTSPPELRCLSKFLRYRSALSYCAPRSTFFARRAIFYIHIHTNYIKIVLVNCVKKEAGIFFYLFPSFLHGY